MNDAVGSFAPKVGLRRPDSPTHLERPQLFAVLFLFSRL